jgi:hypothetical protein
MCVQTDSQN